jgi:hypothetical protein
MTLLTADDLAYTRATQGQSLTDSAIIEHLETMEDGMGGSEEVRTFTPDIPCRVAPLRVQSAEALIGGQLQGQLPWHITLPFDTLLDVSDRIYVGGTLTGTPPNQMVEGGRGWEVLAIYAAHTYESARQLLTVER